MSFVSRKYDGDDSQSWAVFRKEDLPEGHRGIVFYGEATPILSGLTKLEASCYQKSFEQKAKGQQR